MWSGTSLADHEGASDCSASQDSSSSNGETQDSDSSCDTEREGDTTESQAPMELNGSGGMLKNDENSSQSTAISEDAKSHSPKTSQSFHCGVCDKFFKSKALLLRHQMLHTGEKPHHCTECSAKFSRKESLKAHMLIHEGIKPFHCKQCDYKSRCHKSVLLHQKIHERGTVYRCSECEFSSIVRSDMISHLIGSHSTGKGIVCHLCLFGFSSKTSLTSHMEKIHPQIANVCQTCNYRFSTKSALQRHMLTHTDDKPFKCSKCDKEFRRVSTLRDHMRVHENAEAILCKLCKFTCLTQKSMNNHMATAHQPKSYKFKCSACEFSASSGREAVAAHITEAHADAEDSTSVLVVDETVDGFKEHCKICDKTFSQLAGLKRHMLLHTGALPSFSCTTCGRTFTRKDNLDEHMKTHSLKMHNCDQCSFKTPRSTLLNKHIQSMHGDIDFCCSLCGFKAKLRDDLTIHMFEKHDIKKALYCIYCPFGFADRSQVCAHTEAEHPEAKIFSCEDCDEKFIRNSSFRRHVKTQHSALLPFQCSSCERAFNRSDRLKAHFKVHHLKTALSSPTEQNALDLPSDVKSPSQVQMAVNVEPLGDGQANDQNTSDKSSMEDGENAPTASSIPRNETYFCSKCRAKFDTSAALSTHQQNCIAQDTSHQCMLCNRTFERRPYLLRHMRKKHKTSIKNRLHSSSASEQGSAESKVKPFTCPQCGDKFSRNSALLRHARSKHASRKPFSCNKCGKEFTRNDALTKHLQTHVKETSILPKNNDCKETSYTGSVFPETKDDNVSMSSAGVSTDADDAM